MSTSTLKKVALYTLGAFSGVALSLSVQSFAAEKDKKDNETLPVQSIRNMAEVYGQIKANYYQDKSDADLFEGAMKGMVSDLDPHSEYMDKKGYADMKESTSGEFGGLGMEIGQEDGFIKVIAPSASMAGAFARMSSGSRSTATRLKPSSRKRSVGVQRLNWIKNRPSVLQRMVGFIVD